MLDSAVLIIQRHPLTRNEDEYRTCFPPFPSEHIPRIESCLVSQVLQDPHLSASPVYRGGLCPRGEVGLNEILIEALGTVFVSWRGSLIRKGQRSTPLNVSPPMGLRKRAPRLEAAQLNVQRWASPVVTDLVRESRASLGAFSHDS